MKKFAIALTLSLLSTTTWATPASHSEYTPVGEGNCKITSRVVPHEDKLDQFTSICPGRDKMKVSWSGFDARDWISLTSKGKTADFMVWKGFGGVSGKKLEWRYSGSKLVALIVRMERTDLETDKPVTFLAVIRVDIKDIKKSCIIEQVKTNEEAQAAADDPSDNSCFYKYD
jgi:hypothetical protein